MDATWQRLGDAAGTKGVGSNRVPRRAGEAADAASLARRPRRRSTTCSEGPGSPGRTGGARVCAPATASSTAPTSSSTRSSLGRTASTTRLRHTAPDGARLAAPLRRRPHRLAWVEGRRTIRGTARRSRPRSRTASPATAPGEHPQHRRGRARALGPVRRRPRSATKERSEQARLYWERLAPGESGSVPHCHSEEEEIFVILEGDGALHLWPSQSFAAVPEPSRRRFRSGPATWSPGPPATRVSHASGPARKG
jgi:mannose-6-phosphate isomerase-like protein (cupin superfamily)